LVVLWNVIGEKQLPSCGQAGSSTSHCLSTPTCHGLAVQTAVADPMLLQLSDVLGESRLPPPRHDPCQ